MDWADWSQNRQISDIQVELSTMNSALYQARSSTRKLQSELSKVTGSLEARLSRLSAAFDAFVEISDLRVTLALFDDHARVRHRARQLFGEHPLPGAPADVEGYWLAPALAALESTVDGEALELARSRDARRATLFHVLATGLLGRQGAVTESTVAELLTEIAPNPLMYQRALWLLVADGHLDAGRELVVRKGVESLARLEFQDRHAAVSAWQKAVKPDRNSAALVPSQLGMATGLVAALDASERVAVLRHWVAAGLDAEVKPADEVDPIVKTTLQHLVDEGSPLELPLLARERELRKVIESTRDDGPDGWESPVGTLVELLQRDIVDEEHPGRRAVAIRICAQHILEAAQRLADEANKPVADEVQARTSLGTVTITRDGPVQASLDRAAMRRTEEVDGRHRGIAYSAAGMGVVLLAIAVFAGWGWAVPAFGAFAVTAWQLRRDRAERARANADQARTRARLRSEADACVEAYRKAGAELELRRARIDDDLAALRATLAG